MSVEYDSKYEYSSAQPRAIPRPIRCTTAVVRKPLTRQNTFVLDSPSLPSSPVDTKPRTTSSSNETRSQKSKNESDQRVKSSSGIRHILESAANSGGLTDDAKRYITNHFSLLTSENRRLSEELEAKNKQLVDVTSIKNELKDTKRKLEKEKAKNKMLSMKVQEAKDNNGDDKDDISYYSLPDPKRPGKSPTSVSLINLNGSQSLNSSFTSNNRASLTSSALSNSLSLINGTSAIFHKRSEAEQLQVLQKKVRVYRSQVAILRQDLEALRAILSRELGEDGLELALKSDADRGEEWRGRAEELAALKQTVIRLQTLLENTREGSAKSEQYFADSEQEDGDELLELEEGDDQQQAVSSGKSIYYTFNGSDENSSFNENKANRVLKGLRGARRRTISGQRPRTRSSSNVKLRHVTANSSDANNNGGHTYPPPDILSVNDVTDSQDGGLSQRKISELLVLSKVSEVEKEKLRELVSMLTARLGAWELRTRKAELRQKQERVRAAHLEKLLERSKLELSSSSGLGNLSRIGFINDSKYKEDENSDDGADAIQDSDLSDLDDISEDQLRWEVRRLRLEVKSLRRQVSEMKGAREEMAKIYQKMLEEARQIVYLSSAK